jgi:hypothetical protein
MIKTKNWLLMALLAVGISMNLTSCKEDNDNEQSSTFSLDEKTTRFGVETDMESAIVALTVKCAGEWSAAIDKDAAWVTIAGNELFHKGNGTLELLFDENRTGVDRTATLYLTDDADEVHAVTLRQTALFKGEVPDNSNIMTFGAKGLGCGVNINQVFPNVHNTQSKVEYNPISIPKLSSVYNLAKINSLMAKGSFVGEQPYMEDISERAQATIVKWDSLVSKDRTLDATLNLEISFGFFNMEVGGHYQASDTILGVGLDYAICRDLALYNAFVSPTVVRNYAVEQDAQDQLNMDDDWIDEQYDRIDDKIASYEKRNARKGIVGLTADQQATIDALYDAVEKHTYGGVFSGAFAKLYQRLLSAYRNGKNSQMNDILEQIDAEYGPFIIGRTVLGGSLNINCWLDNTYLSTHGVLEVQAALEGDGIGSINGELHWSQNGVDYVRSSRRTYDIYGGRASDLMNAIEAVMESEDPRDSEMLNDALNDWVMSLYGVEGDETSNSALIAISLTGVWTLFDDPDVQNIVKQFFLDKYEEFELQRYVDLMIDVTK